MGEKKGVREFLKKTFEMKKKPTDEDIDKKNTGSKSASSKSAASRPAASKSAASKSAASKSAASKPAASKPAAFKPAASKPAASKPVASKPAASKPAASKPVASKPAASKPAASKPAASKLAASKPAASKPAASKPAASKLAASKPAASKPAASKPLASKPVDLPKNMTKADSVRFYIYQNYFKPAKIKGQNRITLTAGDVQSDMGLKSEMPTVTSAMKTRIDRLYDVEILDVHPAGGANSKLTVKYDLRNLYMEEESVKSAAEKIVRTKSKGSENSFAAVDSESSYLILKELEEKLRKFVSDRVESRFGKEWWKGTDMKFLADRWNERRIMNDRTAADKKSGRNEQLIHYASFSDYRRIINNPFAWDAFEDYFPDRGWIIQRLKELDPIRNAIMHHTPLDEDDYVRLGLYTRDILKIVDKNEKGSKTKTA